MQCQNRPSIQAVTISRQLGRRGRKPESVAYM